MNKEAIKLIDRLYKDLYLDEQVLHHSSGNKYDKFNNINEYLEKLESVHNRVIETGRHAHLLKSMYYKKYVIKEEDIPESYYKHQAEVALERGYGHIEITESQKNELQKEIIENQKKSLDTWLDYFLSEDAKVYPFWAKYWAFQGMLRLGNYDKGKGEFGRRTKDTVAPFCDLNREALAMSIDLIIKLVDKEEIEDKDLEILVKSGSFKKIYEYILKNVLSDNKNITKRNTGKWIKYDQGSDHMQLVESLKGYNTGWCTAGEYTAKEQLSMGDFYVYYTLDENNEYKVPRIAIRMEYGKIGEIRGVAKDQNIEPEMEEVVEEKIKDFPDKEEYYKKVNDMKLLTRIYKKHQNNEEITKEDLKFLYEIDDEIKGFGYEADPRIQEILCARNRRKDLADIFECREDQISLNDSELNSDIVYYEGNIDLDYAQEMGILKLPKYVKGNVKSVELINSVGIELPEFIEGDLNLGRITSAEGLRLPKKVGGILNLSSLQNIQGLELPKKLNGGIYLGGLINAQGLSLPNIVKGDLLLRKLESAEGIKLPTIVEGGLSLSNLKSTEGLVLPEIIKGDLYLSGLTSSKGLILPKVIERDLYLGNLVDVENLVLPQTIGRFLILENLTSTDGLIIPDPLTYTIYMKDFEITPENVHEYRNNKKK